MTTKTRTRSLLAIAVVSMLAGMMVSTTPAFSPFSSGQVAATEIPTARVVKGPFERTVKTVGELRAAKSSIIAAPYDGKVIKLLQEGSRVGIGDPVIWLDTESLQKSLEEEEAKLALSVKDLEAAEEGYHLQVVKNEYDLMSEQSRVELAEQKRLDAERTLETERVLVEKKISPQSRLDEAELKGLQAAVELRNARINLQRTQENLSSNLRVQQTKIDKAKLEVDKTQRKIDDFKDRIDKAVLRANAEGEVSYFRIWKSGTSSKIAEGDSVWPQLNLVEIPDRSQMMAVVPVNELDISLVKPGQKVTILLDALPGRQFTGTVERKSIVPIDRSRSRGSSSGTGPREFEVNVRVDGREEAFFQGMTASVLIQVDYLGNSMMVPLEALTLEDEKLGVWRTSGDFVEVKVLRTNEKSAAVEAALAETDSVYLRHPRLSLDEARDRSANALRRIQQEMERAEMEAHPPNTEERPAFRPGGGPPAGGMAPGAGTGRREGSSETTAAPAPPAQGGQAPAAAPGGGEATGTRRPRGEGGGARREGAPAQPAPSGGTRP